MEVGRIAQVRSALAMAGMGEEEIEKVLEILRAVANGGRVVMTNGGGRKRIEVPEEIERIQRELEARGFKYKCYANVNGRAVLLTELAKRAGVDFNVIDLKKVEEGEVIEIEVPNDFLPEKKDELRVKAMGGAALVYLMLSKNMSFRDARNLVTINVPEKKVIIAKNARKLRIPRRKKNVNVKTKTEEEVEVEVQVE